jgi:hypothetical protein
MTDGRDRHRENISNVEEKEKPRGEDLFRKQQRNEDTLVLQSLSNKEKIGGV